MAGNTGSPGTTVTSRVLAILGAFDTGHRALTLTDIADRAGIARPTAHRLIAELTDWGALRRDGHGRYVIGRRLWDLGLLAPVQTGLRDIASPFLHDLYGATLATVHLAVRDETTVLYLDTLRGHASVPIVSRVGSRLPLHATGVGKVLLAHAPDEVRRAVLTAPLQRLTAYTITQPAALERQLARIRTEGYATTQEEMTLGACSAAVPITVGDQVVAALGIVVPDLRRTRGRLVAALQVASQGIARSLGAPG
jgi:DNA-binding IclR family transcriptional regulator